MNMFGLLSIFLESGNGLQTIYVKYMIDGDLKRAEVVAE